MVLQNGIEKPLEFVKNLLRKYSIFVYSVNLNKKPFSSFSTKVKVNL